MFSLWQKLDVICTFFIHPEHYMNATLFQSALQIYSSARFSLEWWTCSASVLVGYVVQARGRKDLCGQLLHSVPIMGQICEHKNSVPQVSCISPMKEEVLKQGMKNMSKGFTFVVVWFGLCQLCFMSREVSKDSCNFLWKRRWAQSCFTNFMFVKF